MEVMSVASCEHRGQGAEVPAGRLQAPSGAGARAAGAARLPELLAPAGSFEALLAALAAGADAVYAGLAAPGLDARAAAPGLTAAELARACALAHARGARVYVTLNALVYTAELDRAVACARAAMTAGADAFIVADLGLASRLACDLPAAELHLSTQAGAQAAPAVAWAARELGCSRVTVARELSVAEIARACATGVEVEAFCHGAICICYSGACGLSAHARGRSAMRGDCTQPCRQPWALTDASGAPCARTAGDKLLCPKDYLGLRALPALVRAGVGALKIEGRMKNPDYVYNVVGAYRAALDALAAGEEIPVDALIERVGRSFNRGFTDAYPRGDRAGTGRALMSFERSCNQGVPVGTVVARGHRQVSVELTADVAAGDTLEIHTVLPADAAADVPRRWPLVPCTVDARAGEQVEVACKRRVAPGSAVYLTASAAVRAQSDAALARLAAEAAALAVPAVPELPEAPAAAPEGTGAAAEVRAGRVPLAVSPRFARTAAAAARLLEAGTAEVAVEAWRLMDGASAWEPMLPRLTVLLDAVFREGDEGRCRSLVRTARRVICRNLGEVALCQAEGVRFDVAAPVYAENEAAVGVLVRAGAARIWLSDELSAAEAAGLAAAVAPLAPVGRLALPAAELMVMEHCVLTAEGPCDQACATCRRRAEERFLVGADGARYAVATDALGRSRIFAPALPADSPRPLGRPAR